MGCSSHVLSIISSLIFFSFIKLNNSYDTITLSKSVMIIQGKLTLFKLFVKLIDSKVKPHVSKALFTWIIPYMEEI